MAKISSSQPQRQKAQEPPEPSAKEHGKEPGPNDGILTLGEAQQQQSELREARAAYQPESLWDNAHAQKEEKRERDELHQHHERAQGKKAQVKSGQKAQAGRHQPPPARAKKQDASLGLFGAARRPGDDGFETRASHRAAAKPRLDAPAPVGIPVAPPPRRTTTGAMQALTSAKDAGVYFREEGHEDGRAPEESEDPELAAAVEECIRLLFGVRGILRVGPGTNDKGEPVIVITPHRGFTHSSMRAIPERVHRFKTLVALPYDLLPLRREG